jgi:uncharacterized protein (TIGR03118 family)
MRHARWPIAAPVFMASACLIGLAAAPSASAAPTAASNSYVQVNLIANSATYKAKLVDKNLTNAWGMAAAPGSPLWISDNNSGMASVYSGGINGGPVSLDLTVPVPGGNPTGQVYNSTSGFPVGGSAGSSAQFIVSTDSIGATQSPGEIAAWNGGSSFVVEDSPKGGPGGKTPAGAVFKGLALSGAPKAGPELFATDVHNATVDVFNKDFHLVSTPSEFHDKLIPAGYAPFNIQLIGGLLYVTYGKQNATKTDVIPGAGFGFVDVYSVNGLLIKHLVSHGPLNEPWGLTISPSGFGAFSKDLLVGNLGNGWINAFNPTTGKYLGALNSSSSGYPLAINGLWGLMNGSSSFGGAQSVVFTSGPNGYRDGLVGVIHPPTP